MTAKSLLYLYYYDNTYNKYHVIIPKDIVLNLIDFYAALLFMKVLLHYMLQRQIMYDTIASTKGFLSYCRMYTVDVLQSYICCSGNEMHVGSKVQISRGTSLVFSYLEWDRRTNDCLLLTDKSNVWPCLIFWIPGPYFVHIEVYIYLNLINLLMVSQMWYMQYS